MNAEIKELEKKAIQLRRRVFQLVYESKTGHTGSSLSCTDILTALYYSIMAVDPEDPENDARDRYIQSKGHAVEILWAILADKGFIEEEELKTFSAFNSRLIGHPNNQVAGVEMNTGSLGHGLAVATGIALAAKMDEKKYQTYTLLGDGELAEGSVWEAAMAASNYKLDNLTAIIDHNGLQITGATTDVMNSDPLSDKWRAFGWHVIEVDGNNIEALIQAFNSRENIGQPKMIIANTIKGKGVSFAEGIAAWHHKVPSQEQYEQALLEFDKRLEELEDE
ncbi:transketolase [Enterococcus sp. JM4C]|uniref:transketolase n=1 Tax=Candidatus Enterococcus huntleyi TaxID=1857217 RepID=UPI00137A626F|nr:transketolase [Enterococcus sp. JM4C]KAF1299402.1 transketolase [Enterococcus sp. JM4C]